MNHTVSVAVTGAAGQIGYALIFRLLAGQVFGPHVSIDLRLIELPQALGALKGVAMEIEDCQFALLKQLTVTDQLSTGFKNAQWIVCVGSAPRKKGMERQQLLEINGSIFIEQGRAIDEHAAREAKVLVVGNPCNTNALIAMRHAPGLNPKQFFAMTMLDQHRAESQLMQKAELSQAEVECMIFGNHSNTQYPHFEQALINGQLATQAISDDSWFKSVFIPSIQTRGAEVIKARGASSAASAANAIINSMRSIEGLNGNKMFSMVVCSEGQYGSPAGLMVSLPCEINADGAVSVVDNVDISDFARTQIQVSYDELQLEYNMIKELGFLK